jgi:hypothetical protein
MTRAKPQNRNENVTKSYEDKIEEQIAQYKNTENMHDLPGVYHLWRHDYVGPGLKKVFDVRYVEAFENAVKHNPEVPVFLSLGCGDGGVEIGIARTLLGRGIRGSTSSAMICQTSCCPVFGRRSPRN